MHAIIDLYRVIKPGAKALIQTPFKEGEIYEDKTLTSNEDRLKHFEKEDHVRIYSLNRLKQRLESCGFLVEIKEDFKLDAKYGLDSSEQIIIITKPN